jgi:hypothetical protein
MAGSPGVSGWSDRNINSTALPSRGSVAAERLWDALYVARAGRSPQVEADLEDAAFRRYLPLARTLAHTMGGDSPDADRTATEQVAELGLANAVLAWRQRTGAGFLRFARSSIIRELSSRWWFRPVVGAQRKSVRHG